MDRDVRIVRHDQRTSAEGPATPGITREQAFADGGRWVGFVTTEPGVLSGWHHHGETETYFYVLRGSIELEYGPGGSRHAAARTGDFVHVPAGLVHREGTPPDGPAEAILVRIGSGAPVVPADGPDPD